MRILRKIWMAIRKETDDHIDIFFLTQIICVWSFPISITLSVSQSHAFVAKLLKMTQPKREERGEKSIPFMWWRDLCQESYFFSILTLLVQFS